MDGGVRDEMEDPAPPVPGGRFGKPGLRLLWLFELALTCLLLWLSLRNVPLAGILGALARIRLPQALLSLVLFGVGVPLLEGARLRLAGTLAEETQPPGLFWVALFAESRPFMYLMPAAAGSEGMIWLRLRQYRWRHRSCAFVVLLTKAWGVGGWALVLGLVLAGPGALGGLFPAGRLWLRSPFLWAGGGLAILGGMALAPFLLARRQGVPVRAPGARVLAGMALATAGAMGVAVLAAWIAAGSAGIHQGFLFSAGFLALCNFATLLPIAVAGFGLQEALVLAIGLPLGCPAPVLLAFSAVVHAQRLALALAGVVLLVRKRFRPGMKV